MYKRQLFYCCFCILVVYCEAVRSAILATAWLLVCLDMAYINFAGIMWFWKLRSSQKCTPHLGLGPKCLGSGLVISPKRLVPIPAALQPVLSYIWMICCVFWALWFMWDFSKILQINFRYYIPWNPNIWYLKWMKKIFLINSNNEIKCNWEVYGFLSLQINPLWQWQWLAGWPVVKYNMKYLLAPCLARMFHLSGQHGKLLNWIRLFGSY